MTEQDVELIATALRLSKPRRFGGGAEPFQHEVCCKSIANAMATVNPDFNRIRFLADCGLFTDPLWRD